MSIKNLHVLEFIAMSWYVPQNMLTTANTNVRPITYLDENKENNKALNYKLVREKSFDTLRLGQNYSYLAYMFKILVCMNIIAFLFKRILSFCPNVKLTINHPWFR